MTKRHSDYKGDDVVLDFQMTQEDGTPFNTTGWVARYVIQRQGYDTALFDEKTDDASPRISWTDVSTGKGKIDLADTDTDSMADDEKQASIVYDVVVDASDGSDRDTTHVQEIEIMWRPG